MFAVGEKIMYGTEGVYEVSEYVDSPVDKSDDRKFYVLKPVHGPAGNLIYTPIDNDKVTMRSIMTREEGQEFLKVVSDIPVLEVDRERDRREIYKTAMHDADCKKYASIIKTVFRRREEFAKIKKRLSEADTDYEKKAKFCLFGELSEALDISIEEVEQLIIEKIKS